MRLDLRSRERHVRYDRVLLRSTRWRVAEVVRLGRKPLSPDLPRVFPSDHFGVLADLSPG